MRQLADAAEKAITELLERYSEAPGWRLWADEFGGASIVVATDASTQEVTPASASGLREYFNKQRGVSTADVTEPRDTVKSLVSAGEQALCWIWSEVDGGECLSPSEYEVRLLRRT